MSLSLGIVGLPNVGKSTLFNALTKQQVAAENYPFCTIEPNTGIVAVPDERLDTIAEVVNPKQKINAIVTFVDIAGIVKGASEGEGLGNKFLSHIREVDAIVQVVRSFESKNITHVEDSINPKRDIEIIESELLLKDLDTVEGRLGTMAKGARSDEKTNEVFKELESLKNHLEKGKLAQSFSSKNEDMQKELKSLHLLTNKPIIYILNSAVDLKHAQEEIQRVGLNGKNVLVMDVLIESEIVSIAQSERSEYMKELGLEESGLDRLIKNAYKTLGLMSYFTAGEDEARAWTIHSGDTAPVAAGVIHTDFEEKFIAAEVIHFQDFIDCKGETGAKEKGKMRLEGRGYIVQDGDVMTFKHGA